MKKITIVKTKTKMKIKIVMPTIKTTMMMIITIITKITTNDIQNTNK